MNVAEGLGVLLLKDETSARCVEVRGVGYSSDAYHMTKPSPDGVGAKTAMSQALGEIEAKDVDYINAHGTGTLADDSSEALALLSIFGRSPFVSSTKSIPGQTLGASGVIEAIECVEAILKSTIPPTPN